MTSYVMTIVIFALFLTICAIFKFDLENEGHNQGGENWDLRHSTGKVRFDIGDFVKNIS